MSFKIVITYFVLILLLVLIVAVGVGFYFYKTRNTKKYQEEKLLRDLLPKPIRINRFEHYANRFYPYLSQTPLVRILLNRIRMRLSTIHAGDESQIRRKSASYTLIVLLSELGIILLSLIFIGSWLMKLAVFLVSLYIGGFLIDLFVIGLKIKSLEAETELLLDLRHHYNETFNVKESLEKAAEKAKPIVALHAMRIAEIFESEDPERDMITFNEAAPDRYIRQLAGLSFKVGEYGDSDVHAGEKSIYLESLSNIREDIFKELAFRNKLRSKLAAIPFIAASPIFFLEAIKSWAIYVFPNSAEFYASSWGLYSSVLLFVIFFLCFIGVRTTRNVEGDAQGVNDEGKWLNRLLEEKWILRIVDRVVPKDHQPKNFKLKNQIREANSKLSLHSLYLQKILISVCTFILVIVTQFSVHAIVRNQLLHPSLPAEVKTQSTGQQELAQERLYFEKMIMIQAVSKKIPNNDLPAFLDKELEGKLFFSGDVTKEDFIQEVTKRIDQYRGEHYWWYEYLIAFLFSALSYTMPNYFLKVRQKVRKWERQNEVDGFNTTVMMLSRLPSISVLEILEWLERDSYIFKEALVKCCLNYSEGGHEAMEQLKQDARFVPLERIVDRLQNAADKIPIKNAFDDMVSERSYQMELRAEHYEKMISSKSEFGKLYGFTPFVATLLIYLIFPFTYMMFKMLPELSDLVNGL